MRSSILFIFILITQFCSGQNNDLMQKEAMTLFNDGKIKEAFNTLEQIKDKETLENTDINIWKKHFRDILDYKFLEKFVVNDSIKTVTVRTSLFTHCGIYNSNTKKYVIAPIYDDIPNINPISKYFVIALNHQKGLIDLSGKTIIPSGNYDIIVNVYNKFITVVSNDGNTVKDLYNWDGKLVGHNLSFFQQLNPNYIITRNDFNKFQILNTDTGQLIIEDCDAIEIINRYRNPNLQEVFIKKDNQSSIYNFVTKSFSAQNDFDTIITYNKSTNVFSDYQNVAKTDDTGKEISEKYRYIFVKKNSKFGVFDLNQKKYYIEPVYDSITNYGNCLQNKVWRNLKFDFPIKEDYDYKTEAVVYYKDNRFGLKSTANKTITEAQYDEVEQKGPNLFLIKKQKLWGWIHIGKNKTSIVKPQFDYVHLSYDKFDFIKSSMDKEYSSHFEPYFETCFKNKIKNFTLESKEQLNAAASNERGYSKKQTVTNISSNRRLTTRKNLANPDEGLFEDKDLFGLDDKEGKEIVKPIYKKIEPVSNGNDYFVVYNSGSGYDKVGLIDENGKIIIPTDYNLIESFDNNNCYLVREGYYFGLLDKGGKKVVPTIYKEIKVFLHGLYIVKDQDNSCKVIDAQNKTFYAFPKDCEAIYKYDKIITNKGEVFFNFHSHNYYLIKIENNVWTRILEKYNIIEIYDNNIIRLGSNNYYSNYNYGFYNLNTQKLIEPQFKEITQDYAHKFFYCKTDKTNKYFDTVIDENLNITHPKDQITNMYQNVIFYEKDGKYGFFDKNHQKTKNTFESINLADPIESSNQKLYQYYDNKDQKRGGRIDENGKIVIKANLYDQIYSESNKFLLSCKKYKKEELEQFLICTDTSGKTTNKIDFLTLYGNKVASITIPKKDYLVDFISKNGIVLLKASDEAFFFNLNENKIISKVDAVSVIKDVDGGFTILRNDASIVDTKKILAQKYSINGNLISTRIINRNQNTRSIENWNYFITQKKEDKYGIVGVDEKIIVPFVYDTLIPSPVNTVYIAKKKTKFGLIDRDNNVLLNFDYDKIDIQYLSEYENEGINYDLKDKRSPAQNSFNFIVSKAGKTGILDSNLKFILPVEYDSFSKKRFLFRNIIARKGRNSMVYNSLGNFLFQVECDSLMECQNYYKIYIDNKQGILNQKGFEIFPMRYTKVEKTIFENLFLQEEDSKKYITDSKGEIISKAYDEINTSKIGNYLAVKTNNKFGLMNNKGTIVIPELYDNMVQISGTVYVILSLNGKEGIVDMDSEKNKILPIKIPIAYAKIKGIENKKYIIVSNNSKEGVIDLNNKVLIPMIYDSINYQENKNYFICNYNNMTHKVTPDNTIIKVEE